MWLEQPGSHAADGNPQYGGWPAIYAFFRKDGYTKTEIDELPLYWAYLQMGAISADKTNLKLSAADGALFQAAIKEKHASRRS